jgi:hypothetical protein
MSAGVRETPFVPTTPTDPDVLGAETSLAQRVRTGNEAVTRTWNDLERARGDLEAARMRLEGLQNEDFGSDALLVLTTLQQLGGYADLYLRHATPAGRAIDLLQAVKEQTEKTFGRAAQVVELKDQLIKTFNDSSAENLNDSWVQIVRLFTDSIEFKSVSKDFMDTAAQVKDTIKYLDNTKDWYQNSDRLLTETQRTQAKIAELEQKEQRLENSLLHQLDPVTFSNTGSTIQMLGTTGRLTYLIEKGSNLNIGPTIGPQRIVSPNNSENFKTMSAPAQAQSVESIKSAAGLLEQIVLVNSQQTVNVGSISAIIDGELSANDKVYFKGSYKSYQIKDALGDWSSVAGLGADVILHEVSYTYFNDAIFANSGGNRMSGTGGKLLLAGRDGNDVYVVDQAGDTVKEVLGEGIDLIWTPVSYTLSGASEVEILAASQPSSTKKISLTGNNFFNYIVGNAGSNIIKGLGGADDLEGKGGNDVLYGGFGADTLNGGGGKDAFVFAEMPITPEDADTIKSFNVRDDTIHLENRVFNKLGSAGELRSQAFWKGDNAHDRSDRVIYDRDTGSLFYDPDGTGDSAQVQIATMKPGLKLTADDILVI